MRAAAVPALWLVPLLGACSPAEPAGGGGLVILPDRGPLAPGVETRDPRLNFHDFGRVPDGDVVRRVFRLRNDDPVPVTIERVVPGCGCTVGSLRLVAADGRRVPGEPIGSRSRKLLVIPPGGLGELELEIDTRRLATKNTDKLIITNVSTDSRNSFYLSFELHIFVEKPFAVVPGMIQLGKVARSAGGEGKVEIVRDPNSGYVHEVTEILELPPGVQAELFREQRAGSDVWVLRAGFVPPLTPGLESAVLRLATRTEEGQPGRTLEIPLQAQVVEDLAAEPERLVFAAARAENARGEVLLFSRLAGQRLRVLGLELTEEQRALFDATLVPEDLDDAGASARWRVTLATRPPLPAEPVLSGKIMIRLDDPQYSSFELPYVVHVRRPNGRARWPPGRRTLAPAWRRDVTGAKRGLLRGVTGAKRRPLPGPHPRETPRADLDQDLCAGPRHQVRRIPDQLVIEVNAPLRDQLPRCGARRSHPDLAHDDGKGSALRRPRSAERHHRYVNRQVPVHMNAPEVFTSLPRRLLAVKQLDQLACQALLRVSRAASDEFHVLGRVEPGQILEPGGHHEIGDAHGLAEDLLGRIGQPDGIPVGLGHLPAVEAVEQRRHHDHLGLLTLLLLEIAPDQQIEQLVSATELDVGAHLDGVPALHHRVDQLVQSDGRVFGQALLEVFPCQRLRDRTTT
jgi:hypothetical protein